MNGEFGSPYASLYDNLYRDKDYQSECDRIQRIFARYGAGPVRSILDLGCGSGNHAIPLARAGYEVVGIDRSEAMLAHARRKAEGLNFCEFRTGDLRTCSLDRTFDAALMMFAVLGYQLANADVLAALQNARRHLRPGGLLIFDCWYGPAVLSQRPSDRRKTVDTPSGPVTRYTKSALNIRDHTCQVVFRVEGPGVEIFRESHAVRFFFPKELELYLELAGFDLLRLGQFADLAADPDETSWNVLCVAGATL